jgi:uncharacterized protein YueI
VNILIKHEVDEYLQQGIYGKKEIKPEERKKYLGTLRERVIAVLYQSQVLEEEVYPEIIELMKGHPKAFLFLNGNMNYTHLSKYVEVANRYKVHYKLVLNKDYNTDLGLVFAEETAINKEDIYIQKKMKLEEKQEKKSNFWGRLFGFMK